jgi:hypothetical protein
VDNLFTKLAPPQLKALATACILEGWAGEMNDFLSLLDACCPECKGDLVELPRGPYSIRECARGCGWWDETRPPRTWTAVQIAAEIGWAQRSNGQPFDGRKAALDGATFVASLSHTKRSWGDASPLPSITVTKPIVNGDVSVVAAILGLVFSATTPGCCSTQWSISANTDHDGCETTAHEDPER